MRLSVQERLVTGHLKKHKTFVFKGNQCENCNRKNVYNSDHVVGLSDQHTEMHYKNIPVLMISVLSDQHELDSLIGFYWNG